MLTPTGLIHEIYPPMAGANRETLLSTQHFHNYSARAMTNKINDHIRKKRAAINGGDLESVPLEEWHGIDDSFERSLMTEDLMEKLRLLDESSARMLLERYINGKKNEEIAEEWQVSLATVERKLKFARAWTRANWSA